MYRFNMAGLEMSCDTAQELVAFCNAISVGSEAKAPTAIATIPTAARAKVSHKAKPRALVVEEAPKHRGTSGTGEDAIRNLPYISGGLSWGVVKKVAKKLGRDDVRQLRSDLYKRQQMGE